MRKHHHQPLHGGFLNLLLLCCLLWSCKKTVSPEDASGGFNPTAARLTFVQEGQETGTSYVWENKNGLKGTASSTEVPTIQLAGNTTYEVSVRFLQNMEDEENTEGPKDITSIIDDAKEQYVLFLITGSSVTLDYMPTDKDSNDKAVGLEGRVSTGGTSSGQLRMVLRHNPQTKDQLNSLRETGGETVVDISFDVMIQLSVMITLHQASVTVGPGAGTLEVPVRVTGGTIRTDRDPSGDWVTGFNYLEADQNMAITYTENTDGTGRSTRIFMSAGQGVDEVRETLTLTQQAPPSSPIVLSQLSLVLTTAEAGAFRLGVSAPEAWSAMLRPIDMSWLSLEETTDSRLTLRYQANTETTPRRGILTIRAGTYNEIFPIDQPAASRSNRSVIYQVVVETTWSATTHPTNFPAGRNPHFTNIAGATHNSSLVLFAVGRTVGVNAAQGLETLAELGNTRNFQENIEMAILSGSAKGVVSGSGISNSAGQSAFMFEADATHPEFTFASMLAPSSDWFIGVHNLQLMENGEWRKNIVMPLIVYDAGTEKDDMVFDLGNADENPKKPISRLNAPGTDFTNGEPAVGTITLTLQEDNN